MTMTQNPISVLRITRERDDYGRSVHRYSGWTEGGEYREGAAIVRLPATAHANPEHPAYGKPYLVNLDTVRGHREHVVYVATLRQARALMESMGWVQEARRSHR